MCRASDNNTWQSHTNIWNILLCLDQSARSIYWWMGWEKLCKYVKIVLSYCKLFALPELQASQNFALTYMLKVSDKVQEAERSKRLVTASWNTVRQWTLTTLYSTGQLFTEELYSSKCAMSGNQYASVVSFLQCTTNQCAWMDLKNTMLLNVQVKWQWKGGPCIQLSQSLIV